MALPFSEKLCPWLATLLFDAFLTPPDATLSTGWIFQLGYGFVARDCFQHFCGGVALPLMDFAPASAEDDFGYEPDASGPVSGAGAENEFHLLDTSGPVAGNELPDHESGFVNDFLGEVASRGQVRRHAHPVGIGHAPLFQQTKEHNMFCLEISGSDVSRNVESRGASGVIFENDVGVSGSLVLDGAFAVLVDFDVGSSASCTEASNEAAIVPPDCSSSTGCGGKEEKEKDVKRVQFFVNRGKGFTTVVRYSPDDVVSDGLHLDADEYAVCGSRLIRRGCTLSENCIGNGSNVGVLRRLRGGASSYLDIPGQWERKVCHATRCWPARKRCYKCDAPRDAVLDFGTAAPSVAQFWSSNSELWT